MVSGRGGADNGRSSTPPRGVTIMKAVSGPFATVPRPPMGLCEFLVVFFNSLAVGFDVIDADDNVAALQ